MRTLLAVLLGIAAPAVATAADEVVLLDFTAPYCGPCKTIQPQLDQLHRQGYPIRQIDISKQPAMARQFNVKFVPTFVLLVDGKEKWRDSGTERVGNLKRVLDSAMRKKSAARERRPEPSRGGLLTGLFGRKRRAEPEKPEVVLGQQPDRIPDSITNGAMAASVRIRVTYDGKVQFGSGTIVSSKKGRSVILTCAHIMDQAGPNPKVQVDVFINGKSTTFVGKIVGHDINSDVGLITIPTSMRLPIAEVVTPDETLEKGLPVFSIGCNNGQDPTREPARLSGIDRYDGPNNLETNLAPEHGRSGGGLFDSAGRVIGVCSAADRRGNHGLYAGHRAIFTMLNKHRLTEVYGQPALAEAQPAFEERETVFDSNDDMATADFIRDNTEYQPSSDVMPEALASTESVDPGDSLGPGNSHGFDAAPAEDLPFESSDPSEAFGSSDMACDAGIPETIHEVPYALGSADMQAKLAELGGAEVTIVIRPRDPRKSSRIVVIPQASSHFIASLQGEQREQRQLTSYVRPVHEVHQTSMTVPTPTQPQRSITTPHRRLIRTAYPVSKWIDRGETSDVPRGLTGWTKHCKG